MYEQTFSYNIEHTGTIKKILSGIVNDFTNSRVKIVRQNTGNEILVRSSNNIEFNTINTLLTREIHNLNDSLANHRLKKRIEKEKYKKRQNAKAAARIEKQIKDDTENKKKTFKKDHTFYHNGEQSTNPLNGFFGLTPEADCP